jgi:peptide/nickel transport system permease protein
MRLRAFKFAAYFACLLIVISVFSDFLSPNPPGMQNLEQFFQPPAPLHLKGLDGKMSHPFIYRMELKEPLDARYKEDREAAYPLQFFFAGYDYRLFGLIPLSIHLVGRSQAPFYYPLGTDELGRDVLSRVLAGTRTSMLVVLLGLILYAGFGITVGALAGLFGGWIDSFLMRFSEFVLALPALYLVLSMRALLPMRIPFIQTLFMMVGTIAAVAWPPMARGIRGLILQLKNAGFVEAARSLGATPGHIFRRHMLPSLVPFVLSQLAVAAPIFLLGEVILSFLNIGFRDGGESWGSMLQSMKDTRVLTDFWWNLMPLCMVFLTLLCLNLISSRPSGRERQNDPMMRL